MKIQLIIEVLRLNDNAFVSEINGDKWNSGKKLEDWKIHDFKNCI